MKVAFVHDWLASFTGGERVLQQLLAQHPGSDLFTLVNFLPPEQAARLGAGRIVTSFIQNLPFARKRYRDYLPLMPLAIEQFDLSGYDLVVSTCSAVSKGVITGPDQLHLSYIFSPVRYAWDLQHQYLREAGLMRGPKAWFVRAVLHYIRIWDQRTAHGVDSMVTLSDFIARRIRKTYGREAEVIYPPVDTDRFAYEEDKEDYYLTVSRMVPYKKFPLMVEAFSGLPEHRFVVIGAGPEFAKAQAVAGPNVELLGFQDDETVSRYVRRAKAFVFAAGEDFGIAPLEAQAAGTPVLAYGKGGALETIRGLDAPAPTGVFFAEQTVESIRRAVREFEAARDRITPRACRENALRFSVENFNQQSAAWIAREWEAHARRRNKGGSRA